MKTECLLLQNENKVKATAQLCNEPQSGSHYVWFNIVKISSQHCLYYFTTYLYYVWNTENRWKSFMYLIFCSYWPMIIFPVRCGCCSYSKELLDLLLVLDTPDGRALCKGTVKAANLHYSASPKQTKPHFLVHSAWAHTRAHIMPFCGSRAEKTARSSLHWR